jgi:hypothetical protein
VVLGALLLGTPLWAYTLRFPLYNHITTFFLTAALWYVAELPEESLRVSACRPFTTEALRWIASALWSA